MTHFLLRFYDSDFGMFSVFWNAYSIVFSPINIQEVYFSKVSTGCFHLLTQQFAMISAALTNEMASQAQNVMKRLPYKLPMHYEEIKSKIKKNFIRDNSLTLWKFYVLDRSISIASIGTLLTYGILLGTLGKD
ncbi:uncharacterized protein CEXT_324621 [Caerostris extrusa]|uniref:Gustatory receptor n=1 Tax=Caerostris extrusa TaxID=172846 RepID=A0AAV4W7B0_CAEEX|nr:uncharacterized protein CEXT_324621 [Caerostris extrusa]